MEGSSVHNALFDPGQSHSRIVNLDQQIDRYRLILGIGSSLRKKKRETMVCLEGKKYVRVDGDYDTRTRQVRPHCNSKLLAKLESIHYGYFELQNFSDIHPLNVCFPLMPLYVSLSVHHFSH